MNDVKSLLRYVSPEGQTFFNDYFASISVAKDIDDSVLTDNE